MTVSSLPHHLQVAIDGRFHVAASGGMRTYFRALVKALADYADPSFIWVVYIPGFLGNKPYMEMASSENITWKVVGTSKAPRSLPYYLKILLWEQILLPWIAMREGADVLHYLGNNAPLFPLGRVKIVATIHDTIYLLFGKAFPRPDALRARLNALYLRQGARIAARRASRIICDSQASKADVVLHLGIPAETIHVVHLGIDQDKLIRDVEVQPLAEIEGVDLNGAYFVASGTDSPHKNTARVLQAFKLLVAQNPEVKLLLTGTQWNPSAMASMVCSLGLNNQVVITGYLPDEILYKAYKFAKGLVFVSLYEGFGLPALEAMALGTPVITSNIPVMQETAGDAALLVDPTSVDEIAEAMQRLLKDVALVADLRRRGFEQAKKYSLGAMGKGTVEAYKATHHDGRI
jgi:glycosyltransferase involved in cell wall biosynthesis